MFGVMFGKKNNHDNQPPAGGQNQPPAPSGEGKPAKTYRYRCAENCTFQGSYRRQGEVIELPEQREVPHFVLIEEKEGA